jgi:hypothetical protein
LLLIEFFGGSAGLMTILGIIALILYSLEMLSIGTFDGEAGLMIIPGL